MKEEIVKKAVALRYEDQDQAPMVIAKGQGFIAQKIIENAVETGIPLIKSPDQAEILSEVDIGSFIPPELYEAIAEIYAFLLKADEGLKDLS